MNEIKHIHIGRQSFTISVEAHKELRDYLDAIQAQVGKNSDVLDEVELRMAELLSERGISGDKVVLPADINFLKEQLGVPHDFTEDGEQPNKPANADGGIKRLFRDPEHGMIAGVSAGLAAYIGIDVTIVRLLFIILTFASGAGALVYAILWLIVPPVQTSSDRLQMRGKVITVDSLKDVIDRADVPAAARRAGTTFGRGLERVFKVMLAIAGTLLAAVSSFIILSLITATILLLMHQGKVAGEIFFPIGTNETWALITSVASVIITCFFLMLVGISMGRRKWQIPGWGVAALFGILFIVAPIAGALTADSVPVLQHRFDSLHNTKIQTIMMPFKNLDANGHDTRFIFKPDPHSWLEYRYLGNTDISLASSSVRDGTLYVDTDKVTDRQLCVGLCLYSGPDLQVIVHAPELDKVRLNGDQAHFVSDNQLTQRTMTLDVSGNTVSEVNSIDASKIVLNTNGAGTSHIELTLGSQAYPTDSVELGEDGTANISRTSELDFSTSRTCNLGEAFVYLQNSPDKLTVNGQIIDVSKGYGSLQNVDRSTDLNCLNVVYAPLDVQPAPEKPVVRQEIPGQM